MTAEAVRLRADSTTRPALAELADRAGHVAQVTGRSGIAPDLDLILAVARDLGPVMPTPAAGRTLELWESLATLGAADLTVARVIEPHLDALAILAEARRDGLLTRVEVAPDAVWGVFAAEGGPRLLASESGNGWSLTGPKPWCSLGDRVSHALVTAWVDDQERALFAVDLGHPGVRPSDSQGAWAARGLVQVRSTGLELADVPGAPVGGPGWYLRRPGFAWGGIGVSAIWYGAAVALARRVRLAALSREPDQIALMHLGLLDVALTEGRGALVDAAAVVDGAPVSATFASRLALRVRHVVADTVEEVLTRTAHALGPGPLANEEEHARRVSDLELYVRQHHAERDAAVLGRATLSEPDGDEWVWW